jgi:hypothetical protein
VRKKCRGWSTETHFVLNSMIIHFAGFHHFNIVSVL